MTDRVELQLEVDASRVSVFRLLASAEGLRLWLDEAEFEPRVGAPVRLTLQTAVATGQVVAVDPPQHISWTWDWPDEPLGRASVVAFDAIDHGARTHLTLRHVGLPSRRQVELHRALWEYWLDRLAVACRTLPQKVETTHP